MARTTSKAVRVQSLRAIAATYPEAVEGIACKGTPLEKITVKARTRAFVFLGVDDMMVKLGPSLDEAAALAAKTPDRFTVGAHDWVTVRFDDVAAQPPLELLERWIEESYRLVAPAKLAAMLPQEKSARS